MAIKKALDAEFPGKVLRNHSAVMPIIPHILQVNVVGEPTPNVSGALEVVIENKGLVHSKKGGDGYVDTPEKLQKIKDAVKSVIA
jgi:hypothetical protein